MRTIGDAWIKGNVLDVLPLMEKFAGIEETIERSQEHGIGTHLLRRLWQCQHH